MHALAAEFPHLELVVRPNSNPTPNSTPNPTHNPTHNPSPSPNPNPKVNGGISGAAGAVEQIARGAAGAMVGRVRG